MKKIGFLLVMMVGLLSITSNVKAQTWKRLALTAGDTISTIGTLDTVFKTIPATAGYSAGAFKVKYTKISGTVALKAYIYPGDGTDADAVTDSSAAFSNATGYLYFTKTSLPYSHYTIQVRAANGATSTQAVKIEVFYLFKKYDR
jgi:hypothetical protein